MSGISVRTFLLTVKTEKYDISNRFMWEIRTKMHSNMCDHFARIFCETKDYRIGEVLEFRGL